MQLINLIDEGEKIRSSSQKEFYNEKILEEKGNKWIGKSISYLEENYPESALIGDFIEESEKADRNYNNMVSILKGLKDVEEELGFIDKDVE